jgi:chromosome partitioning protein
MGQAETHIIAIANQKGGVGKTTTSVNLATGLAAVGRRVLLVDLDAQANATSGIGVHNARSGATTYDLIINDTPLEKIERKTAIPNLSVLPALVDLSAVDIELAQAKSREFILKKAFEKSTSKFDYIIMDCPPSLGMLTINALTAATRVIVPMQCEYYSLEGLAHLLNTIELVKKSLNPRLSISGILLTMYDRRNKLTLDVENDVRQHLGEKVFQTTIPRNIKISEAPSFGKPAIIYDFQCPGSRAYLSLAREVLKQEAELVPNKIEEQVA